MPEGLAGGSIAPNHPALLDEARFRHDEIDFLEEPMVLLVDPEQVARIEQPPALSMR